MKPKLIESKTNFKVIKKQRNLKKNIINQKRHLYSNIFIFLFIIFLVFVIYNFYNEKKPFDKIKNNNNK